jgi:arylsulfatase A
MASEAGQLEAAAQTSEGSWKVPTVSLAGFETHMATASRLVRIALTWLAAALTIPSAAAQNASTPALRPNIVFILADDLGFGDLSCYGQSHFTTPRLDQMAREGLRFTQHYAGSTVCAPSRACLLGGQHTGHVHQRVNGQIAFRPDPQDITIARLLKDGGYHTAMIGKSGLSGRTPNLRHPNDKGFDHFFGFVSHGEAHRHYPETLIRNGELVRYPTNHGMEGEQYASDLFLAETLTYLNERAEASDAQPFFLHLSFTQPHADLAAPAKWRDRFLDRFEEKLLDHGNYRAEAHPHATFAGMVTCLDDAVGQVLDRLKKLGLDENTVVFFASDNGAMSEGGWSRENFRSSGPLRGGKRDMYEGGIRVPMIAWWPGGITPSVSDHISAFWDFVPTACQLAGIAPPADTDGISYVPTLLGQADERQARDFLYWEFYEQGGKQAVRERRWKAIRLNALDPNAATIELYDLESDLGEEHDVARDHADVVARLSQRMQEAHVGSGDLTFPWPDHSPAAATANGDADF